MASYKVVRSSLNRDGCSFLLFPMSLAIRITSLMGSSHLRISATLSGCARIDEHRTIVASFRLYIYIYHAYFMEIEIIFFKFFVLFFSHRTSD